MNKGTNKNPSCGWSWRRNYILCVLCPCMWDTVWCYSENHGQTWIVAPVTMLFYTVSRSYSRTSPLCLMMHIIRITHFIFWRTCQPSDISTLRMYFLFELRRLGGCNTNPCKPREKSKSPAPFTGKCPRSCNPQDFPIQISASEHISFCVSV